MVTNNTNPKCPFDEAIERSIHNINGSEALHRLKKEQGHFKNTDAALFLRLMQFVDDPRIMMTASEYANGGFNGSGQKRQTYGYKVNASIVDGFWPIASFEESASELEDAIIKAYNRIEPQLSSYSCYSC